VLACEDDGTMKKHKTISFTRLRQMLLDLGFAETVVPGSHSLFEHDPSDTWLVYRPYRPNEMVSPTDLANTRFFLDQRGLVERDEFEELVRKAPA
jgi:hypothetical protein